MSWERAAVAGHRLTASAFPFGICVIPAIVSVREGAGSPKPYWEEMAPQAAATVPAQAELALASPSGRRFPGAVPRRPESGPAGGRAHHRGAAARRRRRGLGQDARAHLPRRAPDRRLRREAERDPRDHVHEQGRRRDARAARGPARPGRARDLDPHLPRRLRPDPAARGAAPRLPLELHDLRPGRPGAADQGVPRGAGARPEALRPARDPRADLEREEPAGHARTSTPSRVASFYDQTVAEVYELYQRRLLRLERGRLRRPADAHRPGARALPRGARALAEGVPLRPRRRVPGHEPRAVPAAPAAGREAPQRLRRRRPGPVDLRLPRRRHPQHPRVRARLRRDAGRSRSSRTTARRTRSFDAANAVIAHNRERKPKNLWSELGEGEPGARARGRGRARRGALRRRRDRRARRGGLLGERDRGLLPDERAVAGARGRARPPGDRATR